MVSDQTNADQGLVIVRTFKASKETVFNAFSNAEALGQWWGPAGAAISVVSFNFQLGGMFHYKLDGNGMTMWGRFIYKAISRPDSIEFVSSFSDAEGNISTSPFPMDFPLEIYNHLSFEEHDGQTTITLKGHPINATAEQEATYKSIIPSMHQGFGGTFDKLDEYLEKTAG